MASFRGTFDEFYQWADPRTRFWITQETRKKRRDRRSTDGCANCRRTDVPLTAAHVTPRKDVVRKALDVDDDQAVLELDLDAAWARIKDAHRPFEARFQYLCGPCHLEADARKP